MGGIGDALFRPLRRALAALGLGAALAAATVAAATAGEPARDAEALAAAVRSAYEARDLDRLEELVLWKDAGKIKKRVVSYQLRSGFGRPIRSVEVAPFVKPDFDAKLAAMKLGLNMPATHTLRVVWDEPPSRPGGAQPSATFLIGERADAWRIALVVRQAEDDDD